VADGEVEAILDELTKAREKIYDCYSKLTNLGVIVIKNESDSGN
jgi:hypothetical protein